MVVDDQLAWGHAVACANLDDDPEQELVIGVRDNQSDMHRCGVRVYDPSASSSTATKGTIEWKRTLIDAGGVAVEDLVTADFDHQLRIKEEDYLTVGRATHNAKLYLNRK